MIKECVVRTRIDMDTKKSVDDFLNGVGINMHDAIRIFLVKIAKDRAFPFNPFGVDFQDECKIKSVDDVVEHIK